MLTMEYREIHMMLIL